MLVLVLAFSVSASVAGVAVAKSAFCSDVESDAVNDSAPAVATPMFPLILMLNKNLRCCLTWGVGVCCYFVLLPNVCTVFLFIFGC